MSLSNMTKDEIGNLILRLQEKKKELQWFTPVGLSAEKFPDPIDEAGATTERDLGVTQANMIQAQLKEVTSALQRIEDGDYGVCVDCDEYIHAKRLSRLPWASRCIECQTKAEEEEKKKKEKVRLRSTESVGEMEYFNKSYIIERKQQ